MTAAPTQQQRSRQPSPARKHASTALIVLAGFALAVSLISIYAQNNVFDSARFADHAQTALESGAVRQVAAEQLSNQIISQVDPDVVAVKPLLDSATAAIIDTAAFKRLFRTSVLEVHDAALHGNLRGAALVVANVGVLISEALRRVSPDVARQIPKDLDASLLKVANGGPATDIAQIANANDYLVWLLPALALLLCAGGIAVAPERRAAISASGVAVAGAGAAVGAAYLFTKTLVLGSVAPSHGVEYQAASAVWDAFMQGLFIQAVGVTATGAAIAAAASGALRTTDVDHRVREIAGAIIRPPQRLGWRIVWSVVLVLLGGWAIVDPLSVLMTAVFLGGMYLLFRGLNELISIAMPGHARIGEPAPRKRFSPVKPMRIAAIFVLLCVSVVILAAAAVGNGSLQTLGVAHNPRECNGAQSLCDRPFNEVVLPTTHNSMSDKTAPGWLFPEQDGPIAQQLSDGIRGLMIDVYYGFPGARVYTDSDSSSPGARQAARREFGSAFVHAADRIRRTIAKPRHLTHKLYACHGFCELGALDMTKALAQVQNFLVDNPREVTAIVFEDYVSPRDLAVALQKSGVAKHAYRGPVVPPWPTLREMIDKDQRILLMTENATPTVPWMHRAYDVMQDTKYHFTKPAQLRSDASCDRLRGKPDNPLFLVNHWVDTAPASRPSNARIVNRRAFLLGRVRRCEQLRHLKANLIAVDFYKQGDLLGVADTLNGVR